jgi:hypothetical protein
VRRVGVCRAAAAAAGRAAAARPRRPTHAGRAVHRPAVHVRPRPRRGRWAGGGSASRAAPDIRRGRSSC